MRADGKGLPRVLLDTNCYIHLLTNSDPEKARAIQELVDVHPKKHLIVLPEIVRLETIAVASKGANGIHGGDTVRRRKECQTISEWFKSKGFIPIRDFYSDKAEQVILDHGLKAPDAMILASAITFCSQLYTYDSDLLTLADKVSVKIDEPPAPGTLFSFEDVESQSN